MSFVPPRISLKQPSSVPSRHPAQRKQPHPTSGETSAIAIPSRRHNSPPQSFSHIVNAPYTDPPPPVAAPPKSWIRSPTASSSRVQVEDTPGPVLEDGDDGSDEEEPMHDSHVPRDVQWRPAYVPEPRWAWAGDQPLSRTQVFMHLNSGSMQKTDLVQGMIGQRNVTFIRRNWTRASADQTGLYKELKLFASERYLRPLQGVVVPYLINVYDDVDTVALVMEPPHHTFWMEASSELPNVLKKRVIEAYIKLHQQGVLHGSAETHNMLINADGRVMLVDFSEARATRPIAELGLHYADRKELELELRKVMFKLNYEGAWKREQAKMKRVTEQTLRNEERRDLRTLKARGLHDGVITPDELPTPDDYAEPPPHPAEWNNWCAGLGKPPKRFIVPGQTSAQVGITIRDFYLLVKRLEREHAKEMVSPLLASGPLFLLPVPYTPFVSSLLNNRKRKASEDLDSRGEQHLAKRLHDMLSPLPSTAPGPKYKFSSKTYSTGTSEKLLPAESSSSAVVLSKPAPAVKVKDYADVPYDGPRGFYFPFPPNEYIMASHRIAHIRNGNAIECGRLGLPYYRGDINMLRPPSYRRPLPKGMHISLGSLKRKREAGEGKAPVTREEQREANRQRFMDDRDASLEEERPIRFSDDVAYVDMPVFAEHSDERLSAPFSLPRHRRDVRKRGILKPVRPVKKISYDLRLWPFEAPPTSVHQAMSILEPPSTSPSSVDSPVRSSATSVVEPESGVAGLLSQLGSGSSSGSTDASNALTIRAQVAQQPDYRRIRTSGTGAVSVQADGRARIHRRAEAVRLSAEELEEDEVERSLEDELAAALYDEDEDDRMLMDVYAWLAMRPGGVDWH